MNSRTKRLNFIFHRYIDKKVNIIINQDSRLNLHHVFEILKPDKIFVVSDSLVASIYAKSILEKLNKNFYAPAYLITHPPNEKSKNIKTLQQIIKKFFENKGSSKSCICALGGGITGNMAGLASSIIYRGIKLVHVPTTLLAQLDNAPDVKQSVNAFKIKNAIGSYKAPDFVVIDPIFLQTLPDREIKSGLAEAIKHALAQDLKFLNFIVASSREGKLKDIYVLEKVIYKTISLKIQHWKDTPTKWNETKKIERLTHLGHTTGKILEVIDLDYLTHGEAISHGMIIEFFASSQMGYLDPKSVNYAKEIFRKLKLFYPLNEAYTVEAIIDLLYPFDKKNSDLPIFALLKKLGDPNTISTTIPKKIMKKSLEWYLKEVKIKK